MMKDKLPLRLRIVITFLITILVWSHIIWDYFHGEIPIHYILQDDNLPGIANWWGGLVLPFFTWFLLYRIHIRIDNPDSQELLKKVVLRFLAAMSVAIVISICYVKDIEVVDYILGAIFLLAFVFPIYKSEYLLGWVTGASFTFGAIIPIGFGSILCLLFFVLYKLARVVGGLFYSKTE